MTIAAKGHHCCVKGGRYILIGVPVATHAIVRYGGAARSYCLTSTVVVPYKRIAGRSLTLCS